MATAQAIVSCVSGQGNHTWLPTTLDQLQKSEEFFEEVLAACPKLMGLESRRSGIRGSFSVFRQLGLITPSGRTIYPDLVLLAASGHVIVVEIKRYVNPELRDRAVIAQIIDYASSFAALDEDQVKALFEDGQMPAETWPDLVQSLFPEEQNADELSEVLLNRMQTGELNLVIACDKVPVGLPDVVAGIASQETLGFDLDLVEITPYVTELTETADIIFVPSTRLQTEIVARTAVTVAYRQGDARPQTSVQTTSVEDVKENVLKAERRGNSPTGPRPERLEYWQAFQRFLQEHAPDVNPSRPTDDASLDVSLGCTGVRLKVFVYGNPTNVMGVRFKDRTGVVESLPQSDIEEIERVLDCSFGRGKKKAKGGQGPQMIQLAHEVDISDCSKWPEQHKWLLDAIRKLDTALSRHIKAR